MYYLYEKLLFNTLFHLFNIYDKYRIGRVPVVAKQYGTIGAKKMQNAIIWDKYIVLGGAKLDKLI